MLSAVKVGLLGVGGAIRVGGSAAASSRISRLIMRAAADPLSIFTVFKWLPFSHTVSFRVERRLSASRPSRFNLAVLHQVALWVCSSRRKRQQRQQGHRALFSTAACGTARHVDRNGGPVPGGNDTEQRRRWKAQPV
jgi:hypothetical protein